MQFGKADFDPARNPAVLDTATWDMERAAKLIFALPPAFWDSVAGAITAGAPLPMIPGCTPHTGSLTQSGNSAFFLATLDDGQMLFLELAESDGHQLLGEPHACQALPNGQQIRLYPTDVAVILRYCQRLLPDKSPRALGAIPRLGCGSRMTTALWPALYAAMDRIGFAANPIQNSIRELNLLANVLDARMSEPIYYPGFGHVDSGHTGSTFEGLWVYGVLEALKHDSFPRYGADADHLKIKRGIDGIAPALQVIHAAPYYTFFTIDVSEALDYRALELSPSAAESRLDALIPPRERRGILRYHASGRRIGGTTYAPDATAIARLTAKYWPALEAMQELSAHLAQVKNGHSFDLEFAIDEHPPDITAFESITTDEEFAFVALEIARRQLPISHIAPNFGVEKGVDYRGPDGLSGLERRVRTQSRIANEFGLMLDFHSGDDLSSTTRQVIGRATAGRCHFKISPMPQTLFADTVQALLPDLFQEWYADALAYAQREAAGGSPFAAQCVAQRALASALMARDPVFYHFGFAFVGRRDERGRYVNRHKLYGLPAAFYQEYHRRLAIYLAELATDLFA